MDCFKKLSAPNVVVLTMRTSFFMLIAAMVVISCGPGTPDTANANAADSTLLIVPGRRIGPLLIGDSASVATRILGKPGFSDAATGKAWLRWYTAGRTDSTCVYTSSAMGSDKAFPRIALVRITSPSYHTGTGVHTGMAWKDIRSSYPSAVKSAIYTQNGKQYIVYENKLADLAFDVDESETCVAITVHEKGLPIPQVYSGLHPDMKAIFTP